MPRPIKIQHPTPKERSVAQVILPIGLYCNKALQKAKPGDWVLFESTWKRTDMRIVQICRFRINSPEFTFMLRSIYGESMTIAKLMERWEAWAVVEGIGAAGIDHENCIILEVSNLE